MAKPIPGEKNAEAFTPVIRNTFATVSVPGARMAPNISTSAWRQLRWKNSGAKIRMTVAKRGES
jgi:hypothetical protein